MTELQKNYNKAVEAYIEAFCEKQDLYFEFWVGDIVGDVASISGMYYLDFSDIRHDIDSKQEPDFILQWYEDCLKYESHRINYRSYCMGLRFTDIKD